jgi:Amt family ammonium transporter
MSDWLIVVLGTGALLARVGQALYATGLSRSKNAAAAVTRGLFDLCGGALAFWAVGAAILFQQHNAAFGVRTAYLFGWHLSGQTAGLVAFYAVAVLIACAVPAGTLAERSRFFPAGAGAIVLAAIVIPMTGMWAWGEGGWLRRMGFVDVAGASVLHLTAGLTAAVGAMLVGPRSGKYHRDGSASMIPGHNVPLAGAGAMVVFAGWLPYVAGFAVIAKAPAGLAVLDALLAAAAAGMAAMLFGRFRYGKPDVTLALLGLLGGLVAISAGAGRVGPTAAVFIGAGAGVIVPMTSVYLDLIAHVDDPTGAVSIHAVGGLWGTLATGALLPAGSFAAWASHVGVQLAGAAAIAAVALVVAGGTYFALKATVGLRSREADEYDGLDLAEHDIGAYPDFQQTTIKSYHLREA